MSFRARRLVVLAALVAAASSFAWTAAAPAIAGTPRTVAGLDDLSEKIDEKVRNYIQKRMFNGNVMVTRRGEILFSRSYGTANKETQERNTENTRFVMASVTKPFTAVLTLQQVERGKLKLDERISRYIPGAPKAWAPITLRHLLNHTSGIIDYLNTPSILDPIRNLDLKPEEVIARFKNHELLFKPGTKLEYSNSGYFVLAYILQKVTGKPYARLLQENILDPLGMKDSGVKTTQEFTPGYAPPYEATATEVKRVPLMHPSILFGIGNLYTTVLDLHKFDQALYGDGLLSRATKEQMFTPAFDRYGFGFSIRKPNGRRLAFHTGHLRGYAHRFARYLDDQVTILLLNNVRVSPEPSGSPISDLSDEIAGVVFEEAPNLVTLEGPDLEPAAPL